MGAEGQRKRENLKQAPQPVPSPTGGSVLTTLRS